MNVIGEAGETPRGLCHEIDTLGTIAGLTLSATSATPPAAASTITYDAVLSGDGESTSSGTGFAIVTINGNMMEVHVTFSGLTTGTTASHIHCCTSVAGSGDRRGGDNDPNLSRFSSGRNGGNLRRHFRPNRVRTYNPAFVTAEGSVANAEAALLAALIADKAYLNIHTTQFPGGEILGFLTPTPLPSALAARRHRPRRIRTTRLAQEAEGYCRYRGRLIRTAKALGQIIRAGLTVSPVTPRSASAPTVSSAPTIHR